MLQAFNDLVRAYGRHCEEIRVFERQAAKDAETIAGLRGEVAELRARLAEAWRQRSESDDRTRD